MKDDFLTAIIVNILLIMVSAAFITAASLVRLSDGAAPAYLVIPAIISVFGIVDGLSNVRKAIKINFVR